MMQSSIRLSSHTRDRLLLGSSAWGGRDNSGADSFKVGSPAP